MELIVAKTITQPTLIRDSVQLTENGISILDRRVFPFEKKLVFCRTYEEVAVAIEEMVTQSAGPYFAAAAAMVLAARAIPPQASPEEKRSALTTAGARLKRARVTNNKIRLVVDRLLAAGLEAILEGDDLAPKIQSAAAKAAQLYFDASERVGDAAASMIPDGSTILTHCWGEHHIVSLFSSLIDSGKMVKAICTETRPYLQGARLTAESLAEMGVDTVVITDNMGAHCMSKNMVSLLVTAADRVTMDGHVINKVGTLQLAIAARQFSLPYLALNIAPDREASTPESVTMEERSGEEVLYCMGHRTASLRARGYYPLFDVTPPDLVTAIATDRGLFSPHMLNDYFKDGESTTDQFA